MRTFHSLFTTRHTLLFALPLLFLSTLQPFSPSALSSASPLPLAPLPAVPSYSLKPCVWVYDGAAWQALPRNASRILDRPPGQIGKQLIGTLTIDGHGAVPSVSGQNVLLAVRKRSEIKTYAGLPEGESGIEVTRLEINSDLGQNHLIRTARLLRQGESAATFGAKREQIAVQKIPNEAGVYYLIQVETPLLPGRYALYFPERACEFEVPPVHPATASTQPSSDASTQPASATQPENASTQPGSAGILPATTEQPAPDTAQPSSDIDTAPPTPAADTEQPSPDAAAEQPAIAPAPSPDAPQPPPADTPSTPAPPPNAGELY